MATRIQTNSFAAIAIQLMMNVWLISSVLSNCQFPDFINHQDVWTRKNGEGATLTAYIKPHMITAKYCPYVGSACQHYVQHCVEKRDDNQYIVKHEIRSTGFSPPRYLCIQFIFRSPTVLQMKESEKFDKPSAELCNNIVLNNWPLFSTSLGTAPAIACPFSGGYNMRISSNGHELCSNKMLSPRIESECEAGDGISVDFKHKECIHENLKSMRMRLRQHIDCMATWTDRNYQFVILRPDSDHALCLRIKKPLSNIRHAYLFMDLVCDPGNSVGQPEDSQNFLSIEFERKYIHSVCENEFEGCSDERFCDSDMKSHCKLTCGPCRSDDICAFPEYLRRVWSIYDRKYAQTNKMRYVNITNYEIDFPDVGKFQCLFNNVTAKHRSILLHTFDNGCYPKFTCMETYYSSDTVRQFRLGRRINWPVYDLSRVKSQACKSIMFKKDYQIGDSSEKFKIPKITVIDAGYTSSQNCKLDYEFRNHTNGLYFREGNKCDGCLYHDNIINPESFEVRTINCPSSLNYLEYVCMASFKFDNETTAVVTGTRIRGQVTYRQFLCWVFTGTGEKRKVVVFDAADCNEVQLQLTLAGDVVPKSMFDVMEKPPKLCPRPLDDDPQPDIPIFPLDTNSVTASPVKKKPLNGYKLTTDIIKGPPAPNKPVKTDRQNADSSASSSLQQSLLHTIICLFVLLRTLCTT
ncbi:uncharacterized protein LOC134728268 [Mytilus trossulus]|uniref:uncharacterized protein LOC134728268 n=1 Tax=Mytilus trossulus TaxID=6551 RepID=UPI003004CEAE